MLYKLKQCTYKIYLQTVQTITRSKPNQKFTKSSKCNMYCTKTYYLILMIYCDANIIFILLMIYHKMY